MEEAALIRLGDRMAKSATPRLDSDVARVYAAGDAGVGGALYNCAAIGEHRQFIRIQRGAQSEFVDANGCQRAQPRRQLRKIHGPRTLMNLHGVAPAQADGGAMPSFEMGELTMGATRAIGIARRWRGLTDLPGPDVQGGEPGGNGFLAASQNLERVRGLQRCNCRRHRTQYALGFAGRLGAPRRLGINAAETCGEPRYNRQLQTITAYGSAVDPRYPA